MKIFWKKTYNYTIYVVILLFLILSLLLSSYYFILKKSRQQKELFFRYLLKESFLNVSIEKISRFMIQHQIEFLITDEKKTISSYSLHKIDLEDFEYSIPLEHDNGMHNYILYFNSFSNKNYMYYFPPLIIITITIFIIIGVWVIKRIQLYEKNGIWLGLAKEAAHQLGTPITSLEGWKEYLYDTPFQQELIQVLDGMDEDLKKINLILDRFSQISNPQSRTLQYPYLIITDIYNYMLKRAKTFSKNITISCNIDYYEYLYINEVLFSWTIENLLRNAMDSLDFSKEGIINISMFEKKNIIYIKIKDNGKGILDKNQKDIFNMGFSTKKRGWGLGLALCKRAIEEIHKGKIYLQETGKNGSVFVIEINKKI